MGYNSACVKDICEIFASMGEFGLGRRTLPTNFYPNLPRCHGKDICDKMGYNSTSVKDI